MKRHGPHHEAVKSTTTCFRNKEKELGDVIPIRKSMTVSSTQRQRRTFNLDRFITKPSAVLKNKTLQQKHPWNFNRQFNCSRIGENQSAILTHLHFLPQNSTESKNASISPKQSHLLLRVQFSVDILPKITLFTFESHTMKKIRLILSANFNSQTSLSNLWKSIHSKTYTYYTRK